MKIRKVEMVISAVSRKQYPGEGLPEIAFAGRSNVGKSSLINTLLNRNNFARVSSQPGKTRTINFYRINGEFFLVDLPGYGFARTPRQEQLKWGKMMDEYLNTRTTLNGVLQLVDIRHKPTELDVMMFNWIRDAGLPGIVVATKSDKIARAKRPGHYRDIGETLGMEQGDILIPFSSQKNEGREEVWHVISQLCGLDG
ncbi:MAG: GTP-binding protein EngB [Firmicutes bacterium]|nr:GTP-binding protein EngB [Bacillota bacterium]MDI6705185.1 ribosome biogenesis GTP-binding protein YihA/YsxC [Bacillota bacterium]